ncbi:hypothetical protein Taro_024424, partial [Colocasia esculenta]|nr:hypothetical protein [Colocasia esculenta]
CNHAPENKKRKEVHAISRKLEWYNQLVGHVEIHGQKRFTEALGSVDTPLTSVDTVLQTQGKIMQNWSSSVDTSSGSVDTRDSSQKTFWPIWDNVSTLDQVVSTLETFPEHLLG